jgi:hypothetical protein
MRDPANAAKDDPITNEINAITLTFIPVIKAASRFCETARIALPILVFFVKSDNNKKRIGVISKISIL